MSSIAPSALQDLPAPVQRMLQEFVDQAIRALGPDLRSIVLYGSAAEGTMRATSDVNVMVVLGDFDRSRVDGLRQPFRTAQAAIRLKAMFVLASELAEATEAFAQKFSDVLQRHRLLYGPAPFQDIKPSRPAEIFRLKQVLLNLTLRLREAYVARSLRPEQLDLALADAAGPLRACALTILQLEGRSAPSSKQALATLASESGGDRFQAGLARMSQARERTATGGDPGAALFSLLELAQALRARVGRLS